MIHRTHPAPRRRRIGSLLRVLTGTACLLVAHAPNARATTDAVLLSPAPALAPSARGTVDAPLALADLAHENRPPELLPVGHRAVDPGQALEILVDALDVDGDGLRIDLAGAPPGAALADAGDGTARFTWTPTSAQLGNHHATFVVTDDGSPQRQVSETVVLTVGHVNRPPSLAVGERLSARPGETLRMPLRATDPDGDPMRIGAAALPDGARVADHGDGSAWLTWTPGPEQTGNHRFAVTASDAGWPPEAVTRDVVITVGAANRPPRLERIGHRALNGASRFDFVVSASDPDHDPLAIEALGLPDGAALTDRGDGTARLTWSPGPEQIGNHGVTFLVTDDGVPAEYDFEEVTLSVGAVSRPPSVSAFVDRTPGAPEELRLTVVGRDPDGDALTIDVLGLPPGTEHVHHGDGVARVHWIADDPRETQAIVVSAADPSRPSDVAQQTIVVAPVIGPTVAGPLLQETDPSAPDDDVSPLPWNQPQPLPPVFTDPPVTPGFIGPRLPPPLEGALGAATGLEAIIILGDAEAPGSTAQAGLANAIRKAYGAQGYRTHTFIGPSGLSQIAQRLQDIAAQYENAAQKKMTLEYLVVHYVGHGNGDMIFDSLLRRPYVLVGHGALGKEVGAAFPFARPPFAGTRFAGVFDACYQWGALIAFPAGIRETRKGRTAGAVFSASSPSKDQFVTCEVAVARYTGWFVNNLAGPTLIHMRHAHGAAVTQQRRTGFGGLGTWRPF